MPATDHSADRLADIWIPTILDFAKDAVISEFPSVQQYCARELPKMIRHLAREAYDLGRSDGRYDREED